MQKCSPYKRDSRELLCLLTQKMMEGYRSLQRGTKVRCRVDLERINREGLCAALRRVDSERINREGICAALKNRVRALKCILCFA